MGLLANLFIKLGLDKRDFDKKIDESKKKTAELGEVAENTGKKAGSMGQGFNKSSSSIKASEQAHKRLAAANRALKDATSEVGAEIARVRLSVSEQNQINKLNAQITQAQEGSFQQLEAQMRLNIITMNKMGDEWMHTTDEGRRMVSQTEQIRTSLMRMQGTTMGGIAVNGKAVSSFNGLNIQAAQLARELPALKYGADMFFLAISNNLPMFADEVSKATKANEALKESGTATVPVWKQVIGAFTNWQTLLVLGITALTLFGGKIIKYVSGLLKSKEATDAASRSIKAMNEVLKKESGEVQNVLKQHYELGVMLRKAEDGTIDADLAIKKYNETLGIHYGSVMNLNAAWEGYNRNSEQVIRSTIARATAMKLLDDAVSENLKVLAAQENISNMSNVDELMEQFNQLEGIAKDTEGGMDKLSGYLSSPRFSYGWVSGEEMASELFLAFSKLYNMKGGVKFMNQMDIIRDGGEAITETVKAAEALYNTFNTDTIHAPTIDGGGGVEKQKNQYIALGNQILTVVEAITYLKRQNEELSKIPPTDVNAWKEAQDQIVENTKKVEDLRVLLDQVSGITEARVQVSVDIGGTTGGKEGVEQMGEETDNTDEVLDNLVSFNEDLDRILGDRNRIQREKDIEWENHVQDFNKKLNDTIANAMAQAITTFSEGLGQLATGEISGGEFGAKVLQAIGGFMQQVGAAFITLGTMWLAFDVNIKTGNWVAAIGIGVALVAAGAVLSSLAKKGTTGAVKGSNASTGSGGSQAPQQAGERAPMYYRIATDNERYSQAGSYNVDSQKVEVYGQVNVKGSDLVIALANYERKQGRMR